MTTAQPEISVIIPVFNAQATVRATVASILNQTFKNFELVIVDGGSTDSTLVILEEFKEVKNVVVYSGKDKGVYDAMNKGIGYAAGKWLYFIGSDDSFYDTKVLEDFFNFQAGKDCEVVYGSVWLEKVKKVYDGEYNDLKFLRKNISHQAIFYQKELFRRFGGYDLKYPIYADYVFNYHWFADRGVKKCYFDRIIANFCQSGMSSGKRIDEEYMRDRKMLVLKHYNYSYYLYATLVAPVINFVFWKVPEKIVKTIKKKPGN